MADAHRIIVFVHGYSVTHTNTYGQLPTRLLREAKAAGLNISVKEVFLSRYVSFRDEVRLEDISRGFEAAVQHELVDLVQKNGRFVCITHSTGGPVARDWWKRYYMDRARSGPCPMSHLIMLAPANFGSALSQLGKSRLSRVKTWFEGVEPGRGVLDWLELGSRDSWKLNEEWIRSRDGLVGPKSVFPFVLTGQTIDRKLYDNLNSYTGETGSDGVIRVAAANLNSRYVRLTQETPAPVHGKPGQFRAPVLSPGRAIVAPRTALLVVPGKSHSGTSKGIMRSVKADPDSKPDKATVNAILESINVKTQLQYDMLCSDFDKRTKLVQQQEQVEVEKRLLLGDNIFVHQRYSMVIFRLRDSEGYDINDYDLLLTAGAENDPNHLPRGFFIDRQQNKRTPGTVTYFLNYDIMAGSKAVLHNGQGVQAASPGAEMLGLQIRPRPEDDGTFVHYLPCDLQASKRLLTAALKPNQTTLIDIVLQRVVREGVFRIGRGTDTKGFRRQAPGPPIDRVL